MSKMLVPEPPEPLEGHCSVIYNNTLYTYSLNGFASLPLERNAKWDDSLTPGVLVSDAACVIGGVDGNENHKALYVVGGRGKKSTSDPPGLQRYSFKDKEWKTLPLVTDDIANRTSHSAVYLESSSSILIYGGDIKTDSASASTFILDVAAAPYVPDSPGEKPYPASSPSLIDWGDGRAASFGGTASLDTGYLWDSAQGWKSAFSIPSDIPSGSKFVLLSDSPDLLLQRFDMGSSNRTVRTIMVQKDGSPSKRQTTGIDLPTYDDTFSPTSTPEGFSLAQSDDGLVVISGGSGTSALSMFNQTANSWVNATKIFYGDMSEQEILGSTPTTTSTSSPTAAPTESTTPSGSSSNDSSNDNIGTIIGATLGGLLGIAAILVLILFFIKRKKDKMRKAGGDNGRLSFQDQGVEPLARSAYPMAQSPAPKAASSVDSLAIFSGAMGDEKSPRSAGSLPQYMQKTQPARPSPLNNIQSSDTSEYSMDDKAIEAGEAVRPGDRTTDEGWGKYFQNNSTPTLVGMQSQYDSARGSKATIWPGSNNALPPLDTSFLQQPTPLGRVNSGSPTTEFATSVRDGRQIAIPESQSARISTADSASIISEEDPDRWHNGNAQTQSWLGRPPSSAYSRSFYNPHQSTRDLPTTNTPTTQDYRRHDSARTNTRGSSILVPDDQPLPMPRNNVNSDMSWLNLNADR
ncbi:hypothetical protein BJY04DRAFT_93693 [Aspergillus karnatakaensis]|uniref:uncharacterized protein n=1 Tax=Aspergillus karnatakaensis TaxID=1810916 RepID=UPI003CCD85EA